MNTTEREILLASLKTRFEKNMPRHREMTWAKVQAKLETKPHALKALQAMQATGGEPDVIGYNHESAQFYFCDCSAESPIGRRSLCYDGAALATRKENKPKGSAEQLAAAMGIKLLTEEQYRHLRTLGAFDLKTSSWVSTPQDIRTLGGGERCSVTGAMARFSCITTAQSRTTQPEAFDAALQSKQAARRPLQR